MYAQNGERFLSGCGEGMGDADTMLVGRAALVIGRRVYVR
jgi:hypothetical protein